MFLTKHRKHTSHITIQDWPAWQRTGAIFIGMIFFMIGGSVLFYEAQYKSLQQETEANLETITQLKVDQIVQWRNERQIDALQLINNELIKEKLENGTVDSSCLSGLFQNHPYRNVILAAPDGELKARMKGNSDPFPHEVRERLRTALHERRPRLIYLHTDNIDHNPYLYLIAPLITKNDDLLGALILECDTQTFLYPILSAWPIKSASAETLLLQREGDTVISLNELRHHPDRTLKLRLPITRIELPAVQAVLGKKGVIYGKDYRNIPVIAVSKPIPESPWVIVTKIDLAEAFAPWHFRAGLILALIFGVILITSAIVRAAWLRQIKFSHYTRSLIEAGLDPLVTINSSGKITDLNAATEIITGRTRSELLGSDFCNYFTIPTNARIGYEQAFREGSVRDYPLELRHRNGKITPVLYNATVYRNQSGKIAGVFAAARDISERKLAEEKINYLASIVETSDDVIIGKTLEGRILSWNKGAERIYGYTASEAIGRSIAFLAPDEMAGEFKNIMERLKRGESIEHLETTRQRKDGEMIPVMLTISPIKNDHGEIVGASTIARDITLKKKAEEEIIKLNQELETIVAARTANLELVNKELESFAYSAAHDLRTPLRSIDGFSKILMEDYSQKFDPEGKKYLEIIRTSSQRMGQLIDDILHLSKISRSPLKILPINISDMVAEIGATLKCTDPERQVDLIIQQDCKVVADLNLMSIAMENILSNAWKFTSKQPDPKIEFGMKIQDNCPVYFVRDNGVGFDMQYASKLFGAFQRLHPIHEFPGNGIGLATVQRIIQRHGGKIWIEGRLNEGATVYFTLPQTETIS